MWEQESPPVGCLGVPQSCPGGYPSTDTGGTQVLAGGVGYPCFEVCLEGTWDQRRGYPQKGHGTRDWGTPRKDLEQNMGK